MKYLALHNLLCSNGGYISVPHLIGTHDLKLLDQIKRAAIPMAAI